MHRGGMQRLGNQRWAAALCHRGGPQGGRWADWDVSLHRVKQQLSRRTFTRQSHAVPPAMVID